MRISIRHCLLATALICSLCANVLLLHSFFFKRADRGANKNRHNEGDGCGHCPLREACSEGQRGGEVRDQETAYRTRYGALYAHRHSKDKITSDAEAI